MECYECEKEINLADKDSYVADYVGEIWCKSCMEEEIKGWEEHQKELEANMKTSECDFCKVNFNKDYEFKCPICNTSVKS